MATNKYFKNHTNVEEQSLINDLTVEGIQIAGMDLLYIPRDTVNEDYLYAEDPSSAFTTSFEIEMYLRSVDGFGSDLDMLGDFGLVVNETANFEVSKTRFSEVVNTRTKPTEGDLLYIPMTKSLMEIKKVVVDDPFYQRGDTYVYDLSVSLFEYSQEEFSTGVTDVDDLISTFDTSTDINKDPSADNDDLKTEGDTYIDYTESDPFGDY